MLVEEKKMIHATMLDELSWYSNFVFIDGFMLLYIYRIWEWE